MTRAEDVTEELSDAADRQIEQLLGYVVDADGRSWCRYPQCGAEVQDISVHDDVTGHADWGVWTTALTRTLTLHPCGHRLLGTVST